MPEQFIDSLDFVCSSDRTVTTSASNLVLVLFLLVLQVSDELSYSNLILFYFVIFLLLGVQEIVRVFVHQPGEQVHHEHHSLHCRIRSLLLCCHWICLWISRLCQILHFIFIVTITVFHISRCLGAVFSISCSLVLWVGCSQDLCQSEDPELQISFYTFWITI